MPLVVKKTDIAESSNANTFFGLIETRIKFMNRLKDKETLSDDEFLSMLDFCYTYDSKDSDNDTITCAKKFLRTKTVKSVILDTNMPLSNNVYIKEFVRYDALVRPSFKPKKIYTLEELEAGIAKRELIIITGCSLRKSSLSDELKGTPKIDQETSQKTESLIFSRLSLANLGPYKTWLLPIIKRAFTKKRLAQDILELIEYGRGVAESYRETLEQENQEAEKSIARNKQTIAELRKGNEALSRMREKKD